MEKKILLKSYETELNLSSMSFQKNVTGVTILQIHYTLIFGPQFNSFAQVFI